MNVTILLWPELQEGEHLKLECAEDVDTVQNRVSCELYPGIMCLLDDLSGIKSLESAVVQGAVRLFCAELFVLFRSCAKI